MAWSHTLRELIRIISRRGFTWWGYALWLFARKGFTTRLPSWKYYGEHGRSFYVYFYIGRFGHFFRRGLFSGSRRFVSDFGWKVSSARRRLNFWSLWPWDICLSRWGLLSGWWGRFFDFGWNVASAEGGLNFWSL